MVSILNWMNANYFNRILKRISQLGSSILRFFFFFHFNCNHTELTLFFFLSSMTIEMKWFCYKNENICTKQLPQNAWFSYFVIFFFLSVSNGFCSSFHPEMYMVAMLCKTINDDIHNSYKPCDLPSNITPRHLNERRRRRKKHIIKKDAQQFMDYTDKHKMVFIYLATKFLRLRKKNQMWNNNTVFNTVQFSSVFPQTLTRFCWCVFFFNFSSVFSYIIPWHFTQRFNVNLLNFNK